jgi:rod shape-determining protein MreC
LGNILAFLARYHRFFIFVVLEAICLSLVVNYNKDQGSAFFKSTSDISGRVDQGFTNIASYFHLQSSNDSLMKENARLRGKISNAFYIDTSKSKTITDTVLKQRYTFVSCNVVNNSVVNRNNYITLDIGSNRGVGKDLGVVSTSGIVGVTRDISPHFTSVLSVLHKDFSVSSEITELKEVGDLVWDGARPETAILKNVPSHIRIKTGMHLATSAYSQIFPTGIPIGVIEKFEIKAGEPFYTIYIKLAADMRNIRNVYIVNNLMKEELKKLDPKPEKP